jgi:glucose/arabinose dehydrogenase
MKLAKTAALAALAATGASARTNLGAQRPQATVPFVMTQVATFNLPWRLGFLPDGRMLMTEKVGPIWLVTQTGEKTPVANVPAVLAQGQGGMLGVFLSPHYAEDHFVYLTYSEPGDGGSSLALARAKLTLGQSSASLIDLKVIWRDGERGKGGQFGAQIAFSPESNHLFLTVGDRQRMTPAQDPNRSLGKILRLTSTGSPRPAIRWRARSARPRARNRSARRHRKGQDRAGDPDLCVPGPKYDARRNLDPWSPHAVWFGFRARRQVVGGGAWPQRWRRA